MEMKRIRSTLLGLMALLVVMPLAGGQELSKYRGFSLGTSLKTILKQTEKRMADVRPVDGGSALFQELTWWPPSAPTSSADRSDSVEEVLFFFYKGELYKMSVSYDQVKTEGLQAADMVESISAKYGPATSVIAEPAGDRNPQFSTKQKIVAAWEDQETSVSLVRTAFTDRFGLVICAKHANMEAELALLEAARIDKEEGPAREAERQKKQTDERELIRQKNQKSFRP
jgi:hypothetical protein